MTDICQPMTCFPIYIVIHILIFWYLSKLIGIVIQFKKKNSWRQKRTQLEKGRSLWGLLDQFIQNNLLIKSRWYKTFYICIYSGTYKVRNEIETKRNETKSTKMKRNEMETKWNETNEIDWYEENGRKKTRQNEIKK